MKKIGIDSRGIFMDKQSGKNFMREQYILLKKILRKGDILYIHSFDRFGRNREEIINEWKLITKDMEVDIVVMDMPLLDTTKNKDSIGSFISDLVLQILSWLAEGERVKIRIRQREGIDLAIERGVKFGRPSVGISDEFIEIYNEVEIRGNYCCSSHEKKRIKKDFFLQAGETT